MVWQIAVKSLIKIYFQATKCISKSIFTNTLLSWIQKNSKLTEAEWPHMMSYVKDILIQVLAQWRDLFSNEWLLLGGLSNDDKLPLAAADGRGAMGQSLPFCVLMKIH